MRTVYTKPVVREYDMKVRKYVKKHKKFFAPLLYVRRKYIEIKTYIDIRTYLRCKRKLMEQSVNLDGDNIYYFGVPVHSNLGDLAQGVCIRKWIRKHYPNANLIEIETNSIVHTCFSLMGVLKKMIKDNDLIIFQSGYTTTDLGGYADLMHREVSKMFPNNIKIMMPQTIFFKSKENQYFTSKILNNDKKILFLARDSVSYSTALEMFPDLKVKLFPDIVTTLIGSKIYKNERNGIIFCLRDDTEKYYDDDAIEMMIKRCYEITNIIERVDTTKSGNDNVVEDAEQYIMNEIEHYSKFKVMVTDRYHGTIFSLIAGTPVIVLKTTDHKVVTGADWFKKVLDGMIYVAEDLEHAYSLVEKIYEIKAKSITENYYEKTYYDVLPRYVEEMGDWGKEHN